MDLPPGLNSSDPNQDDPNEDYCHGHGSIDRFCHGNRFRAKLGHQGSGYQSDRERDPQGDDYEVVEVTDYGN